MEFMPATRPSDATARAATPLPAHMHYTRKLPAFVRPIISTARPFAPSSPPAAGRRPERTISLTNTTCPERLIILGITSITRGAPTPTYTTLLWSSVPTRFYIVQERPSLTAAAWAVRAYRSLTPCCTAPGPLHAPRSHALRFTRYFFRFTLHVLLM